MRTSRPCLLLVAALTTALTLTGCSTEDSVSARPTDASTDAPSTPAEASDSTAVDEALTALERDTGARLGLYAVDTATGRVVEHRADERFAFASTSKAFAAAALLDSTDDVDLDRTVPVDHEDVLEYSPVTENYAGASISLREAAAAAVTVSDNTAMNLLLDHIGGPAGLRSALRAVGDTTTEPTRTEPDLNDVTPGETADTSTPRAMATTLRAYAVEDELDDDDRDQLVDWMRESTTGADLVRAGVPDGWEVADKSGTPGGYGGRNNIALVWPAEAALDAPWVFAVLTDKPDAGEDAEPDPDLIAEATAVVVEAFQQPT